MSQTQTLFLWLEGPLQSWGDRSRFGKRSTDNFPTKSGIIGMMFAALGWTGSQEGSLEQINRLPMTVYRVIPVRGCSPKLVDFQTVGNGYDLKDPWQNLLVPKTLEGKKPTGTGSKLTYREYLQDNYFAVLINIPSSWEKQVISAFVSPKWDLYLGRKNCVPTDIVYQGIYDDFLQAEQGVLDFVKQKENLQICEVMSEYSSKDDIAASFVRMDVPIRFGVNKKYSERRVVVKQWS